ncbi:ferric reductase family protein [Aspergillus foveolatus]|uniref:ferric reductase family protein n=1 Tax=Aspergillus foveolatus TaxID=210207 RepID=UPI003CCD97F1
MLRRAALLALCSATVPVLAGQGMQMSADSLDKYCFYSIYTILSEYTFEGSITINQESGGSSHGSSGASSSSEHGSSASGQSSSTSKTSSSSEHGSADSSTSHSTRRVRRRGHGGGGTSTGPCNSTVEVTSLYASAKARCNAAQFSVTIPYWQSLCEQNSLTLMDLSEIEKNVTDVYIAALPSIDPEMNDTTTTGTIGEVVLLSESYYKRAYKSYVTHDYALSKDKRFGWGIMGYWGGILVLGMMAKFISSISTHRHGHSSTSSSQDTESNSIRHAKPSRGLLSTPLHYVKTYIALPASFAPFLTNHQQLFWYHTIPRRLDLLIVCGFWALCIILACVDYQSFEGNIEMTSLFQQNWQYSSDRTGILSYACLPFLWLFGGRNNIFLWATDFNTQSFNIFHRHVAWACTLLAIVHSINYSVVFAYYEGRWDSVWKQEYWYMGVVATILMSFMLVQSMTILRHKVYETFLILHVVFAIVVVYALFRHTSFDGTKWNGYLWPMVAIWAFDRVVRLIRIAYCNLNVRLGRRFSRTTSSLVQYFEDSDLIKIEFSPAPSTLKPAPGQHYYLYQPVTLKGWENHPFTLGAYVPPSLSLATGSESIRVHEKHQQDSKLIFYIRPYDGWTRRLRNQCRKSGLSVIKPKLLLEGPYGHAAPLHTFDTVLMVVGGTGIAAAVPYIIDHISRTGGAAKTRTTRVRLVWSARTNEMFERVFCDELAGILAHEDILTSFYCTSSKASSSSAPSSLAAALELSLAPKGKEAGVAVLPTGEKSPSSSNLSSSSNDNAILDARTDSPPPAAAVTADGEASANISKLAPARNPVDFVSGRPNVRAIVTAEAREAKANSSRLAVLTCGPAQMADECRQTVYAVMRGKNGFRDVEYFEEAFGW